jgi:hypothetical protein
MSRRKWTPRVVALLALVTQPSPVLSPTTILLTFRPARGKTISRMQSNGGDSTSDGSAAQPSRSRLPVNPRRVKVAPEERTRDSSVSPTLSYPPQLLRPKIAIQSFHTSFGPKSIWVEPNGVSTASWLYNSRKPRFQPPPAASSSPSFCTALLKSR